MRIPISGTCGRRISGEGCATERPHPFVRLHGSHRVRHRTSGVTGVCPRIDAVQGRTAPCRSGVPYGHPSATPVCMGQRSRRMCRAADDDAVGQHRVVSGSGPLRHGRFGAVSRHHRDARRRFGEILPRRRASRGVRQRPVGEHRQRNRVDRTQSHLLAGRSRAPRHHRAARDAPAHGEVSRNR